MIWSYKQVILYFGLINRHLWVILQIIRQLEKSQKQLSPQYCRPPPAPRQSIHDIHCLYFGLNFFLNPILLGAGVHSFLSVYQLFSCNFIISLNSHQPIHEAQIYFVFVGWQILKPCGLIGLALQAL
jgi:hypothetical protein